VFERTATGWGWGEHAEVYRLVEQTNPRGLIGATVLRCVFTLNRNRREDPARQRRVAPRFAEAFGCGEEQMLERVGDWRLGGPAALTGLLEAAGRADVARVARLIDGGHADSWVGRLPARRLGRGAVRSGPLAAMLPVVPVIQGSSTV